jgi:hypothetical protein
MVKALKNSLSNKNTVTFCVTFCFLSIYLPAQIAPPIQWQKSIGGTLADELRIVKQASDSGFIFGGSSLFGISGDKNDTCRGSYDYWIVKTDPAGSIQWQKTIGGNKSDALYAIQNTSDSGYILGGSSSSDASGEKTDSSRGAQDYWIVKVDSIGIIEISFHANPITCFLIAIDLPKSQFHFSTLSQIDFLLNI